MAHSSSPCCRDKTATSLATLHPTKSNVVDVVEDLLPGNSVVWKAWCPPLGTEKKGTTSPISDHDHNDEFKGSTSSSPSVIMAPINKLAWCSFGSSSSSSSSSASASTITRDRPTANEQFSSQFKWVIFQQGQSSSSSSWNDWGWSKKITLAAPKAETEAIPKDPLLVPNAKIVLGSWAVSLQLEPGNTAAQVIRCGLESVASSLLTFTRSVFFNGHKFKRGGPKDGAVDDGGTEEEDAASIHMI